ncbi:DNA-3-methyladenine glycosylase [Streptomyces atroolivaceus]|uniref:DNA-3-methyladenine glycosylase n=1 Tax=Streptomyces atroolivaceus TaxID=66869 RepID=UPI0036258C03
MARKRLFSARHDRELAKGPARLTTALDVDRALNGGDVVAGAQRLYRSARPSALSRPGTQRSAYGVGGDGSHQPWRFRIDGAPTVSPHRAHAPRRRAT